MVFFSHTSDLESQIAEQFPNKRKNFRPGSEFVAILGGYFCLIDNHSAICRSRSQVCRKRRPCSAQLDSDFILIVSWRKNKREIEN